MPAMTPEKWNELPHFDAVESAQSPERPVRSVTTAPQGLEGEGFPVRRAFAGLSLKDLDPFVHMDQMGEVDYAPGEPKGTPWHPHRGFETVTYMMDGTFQHQDSHGGGGLIQNGATQWMTAGKGILHIETPPEKLVVSGGLFHGIQLWVNLPAKQKMIAPAYQGLEADDVVFVAPRDGESLVRIIAGKHRGLTAAPDQRTRPWP
jgi:redox-sensitive bicupin YhaK (pirin superfamily)